MWIQISELKVQRLGLRVTDLRIALAVGFRNVQELQSKLEAC